MARAREVDVPALVEQARAGSPRALGRLVTLVENADPALRDVMAALAPHTGRARVVGLTGSPGVGKSTLGGYNDAINVNSPNKATAKDFLSYVISEDVQRGFADQSFPPVLASIYDDESVQEQYPYMEALKAALDNAQPRPVTPFYPGVSKAIQDNTWAAIKDEAPVDEALSNMSDAITQATG